MTNYNMRFFGVSIFFKLQQIKEIQAPYLLLVVDTQQNTITKSRRIRHDQCRLYFTVHIIKSNSRPIKSLNYPQLQCFQCAMAAEKHRNHDHLLFFTFNPYNCLGITMKLLTVHHRRYKRSTAVRKKNSNQILLNHSFARWYFIPSKKDMPP